MGGCKRWRDEGRERFKKKSQWLARIGEALVGVPCFLLARYTVTPFDDIISVTVYFRRQIEEIAVTARGEEGKGYCLSHVVVATIKPPPAVSEITILIAFATCKYKAPRSSTLHSRRAGAAKPACAKGLGGRPRLQTGSSTARLQKPNHTTCVQSYPSATGNDLETYVDKVHDHV